MTSVIYLYMATKRSVVGSGPMCAPGYDRPSNDRIKVVLPVEYWPKSTTDGLASKSPFDKSGEKKLPNL